jgi:hypothetical protein
MYRAWCGHNLDLVGAGAANDGDAAAKSAASPRRLGWANLLARVFAVDVTVCRKCGGRMRILDVVCDPDDIAFTFTGLPFDEYTLSMYATDGSPFLASDKRTVKLAPGAAAEEVVFVLVRGGTLTGHVRDPGGRPLADLTVNLRDDDPGHWKSTRTTAEGAFTLVGIHPTRYEVTVHDDEANREYRAPGRNKAHVLARPLDIAIDHNPPLEIVVRPAASR